MKPMLAVDWVAEKLRFPVILQPKIDGVRGTTITGRMTARSLKPFGNRYVTTRYSDPFLGGLDGEIAAEHECHPDLCRLTTSALTTHEGEPYIVWHLFDYVTSATETMPYVERYEMLRRRITSIKINASVLGEHLRLVPYTLVNSLEELIEQEDRWLAMGYEGAIVRDPRGAHKHGRSTVREGGLLRIKRFVDAEIVVTRIEEGEHNGNEAQTNELGATFRSTHKENMTGNGMVGSMIGDLLQDVFDLEGALLFPKGTPIKVSAGKMPHADRVLYFQKPELLLGQIVKFKLFPRGVKDKPRFPTFQSIRALVDQ